MPGRGSLDDIFDRTGTVRPPPYGRLLREFASFLFYRPNPPPPVPRPRALPTGAETVLVIPAFETSDRTTRPLRDYLARCGYRSFGWELGTNWGPTPRAIEGLRRRFRVLRGQAEGPISLVGVSLGGLFARDLAYDFPADIRQVITLVSPFTLPTASTIEPLFHLCARLYAPAVDFSRLASPLPVPAAAIFTREDGIVAWQSCRGAEDSCTNTEIAGAHVTICRNPAALRAVAERLALASAASPVA